MIEQCDTCPGDPCQCEQEAVKADRLLKAKIASIGGPRERDWADGRNDFARPYPELPWVSRWLPRRSAAPDGIGIGHQPNAHDFPVPEVAPRTRTRRHVRVERPERVA